MNGAIGAVTVFNLNFEQVSFISVTLDKLLLTEYDKIECSW